MKYIFAIAAIAIGFLYPPLSSALHAQQNDSLPSLWTRKTGDDWARFLGPNIDSKSSEKGILTDWSDGKLKVVWQRPLNESYGIGSVSRGRFIQLDRMEGGRDDDRCVINCLNAETGEEIWETSYPTTYVDRYGYNGGPRCSPVFDGDLVYVFGVEGKLLCLQVSDGEIVWQIDTTKKFGVVQNFFGVGSTPVIEGDLLLAMIGGEVTVDPDNPDKKVGSGIVAFDKLTGKIRWQITDELASYASMKTCTIGDRRWGFAFARGGLVGFEPTTGKIDFEFPWRARSRESVNASVPVVFGDHVFISETYGPSSALLKVATGKSDVVWKDELRSREKSMQTHWNTAIEHDGYIYGSSGRHSANAELRCIEALTGKVMWSEPDMSRCSLMYVDGHFVCLGEYGQLLLLKATPDKFTQVTEAKLVSDDGKVIPRLKYPCWAAPILSHGLLYVRGDNRLDCLELIP